MKRLAHEKIPFTYNCFFQIVCLISSAVLTILAEHSHLLLQLCVAGLGMGTATVYATGILWLEMRMTVTGPIVALLTVASSAGSDLFPLATGQAVASKPMFLVYLTLASVIMVALCFAGSSFLAKKLMARTKRTNEGE